MNYGRNKFLQQKMFFDVIIFQTHENFFNGIYHFHFMASDLDLFKFQMHAPNKTEYHSVHDARNPREP